MTHSVQYVLVQGLTCVECHVCGPRRQRAAPPALLDVYGTARDTGAKSHDISAIYVACSINRSVQEGLVSSPYSPSGSIADVAWHDSCPHLESRVDRLAQQIALVSQSHARDEASFVYQSCVTG